jgi:FHA domain
VSDEKNNAWQEFKKLLSKSSSEILESFLKASLNRFLGSGATSQQRSEAEGLIAEISRQITNRLIKDKFPLRGKVHVPPHLDVFLSNEDYQKWGRAKLGLLTQELSDISMEIAQQISGGSPVVTEFIRVKLQIDIELLKGRVRVESNWNESDERLSEKIIPIDPPIVVRSYSSDGSKGDTVPTEQIDEEETKLRETVRSDHEKTEPFDPDETEYFFGEEQDDTTRFKPVIINVWRDGQPESRLSFRQNKIIIGRNSQTGVVDVHLPEKKVHRRHAEIEIDESDHLWVSALGTRPISVDGEKLERGNRRHLKPGQSIQIHNFDIKIERD